MEFADYVDKINRKGDLQHRGLVMSNQNIYKHDPKKFTVKQEGIPISACRSVTMSKHKDGFLIVHTHDGSNRDLVLNFGTDVDKLSEFVTILYQVLKELTNVDLIVEFSDTVKYNNSAKATKEYAALHGSGAAAAPSSPREMTRSEDLVARFEPTPKPGVSFYKHGKAGSTIYYLS